MIKYSNKNVKVFTKNKIIKNTKKNVKILSNFYSNTFKEVLKIKWILKKLDLTFYSWEELKE